MVSSTERKIQPGSETNVENILLLSSRMSQFLVSVKWIFCGVFLFTYIGHATGVSILQSTALSLLIFVVLRKILE